MSTPPKDTGLAGALPLVRRRYAWRWLAVVAVAAAFAVLALSWAERRTAVPPERLSLAVSTTPHAALLHLAQAQGYFADAGLDVSVTRVSHGKAALDLLIDGRVDLAAATEVPFVVGVLEGHPLRAMSSMLSASEELAVVARRDRGINAPTDLIGKRIGVTFGTSGDYFVWAFLTRHRLRPERVTLVDVGPGSMVSELLQGTIDAASLWQPVRRAAETALGPNGVTFTASDAYTVTHLMVGQASVLDARPAAARKLVRALLHAEDFARTQPHHARAVVARQLQLDTRSLEADWPLLEFRVDLRQSQLVTWEDEARWAMARGHARPGPVPNFLWHLHLDALQATRADRVTIVH
jgi:ABC-type nitrate/sulfonate/bicarbonate transport system substrate-binding protein